MMRWVLLTVALLCSLPARADTAHVVAICVAAEVGPDLPRSFPEEEVKLRVGEQVTLLWALHNWWTLLLRKEPELTLAEQTRRYCRIYKNPPKSRLWMRGLPDIGGAEPANFPKFLRWRNYRPRWEALLLRVREWLGPCEGPERIEHWNHPSSEPVGRMARAQCDSLFAEHNRTRFYVVRRSK